MSKKETILVFSAHNDDFVIGAGGTIAKYTKEGKHVISIVFSHGVKSHPWLKEEVVKNFRAKEAIDAAKALGCKLVNYNLKEGIFPQDYKDHDLERKLLKILEKEKPTKIFTHSDEDPHPDHRSVHDVTLQLLKKISFKPEVYIYSIWNPVSFKTKYPLLYIDITKTFKEKINSLKQFPSQRYNAIYPLSLLIIFRAIKDGFKLKGARFAESFFRIK